MDPITAGALISGGFGIGSTLLGGSISSANTGKQIAFEKWKMANAHQMEIRDLEAAGLNPVLSAGGSGASAGSITPQMPDTSGIANAGNAIFQAITAKNATNATNADVKLKTEQATNTGVDTTVKAAQAGLTNANTAKTIIETKIKEAEAEKAKQKIQAEIDNLNIQIEMTKQNIKESKSATEKIQAEKDLAKQEEELKKKENKIYYWKEGAKIISNLLTGATGIIGAGSARSIANKIAQKTNRTTNIYNNYERLKVVK